MTEPRPSTDCSAPRTHARRTAARLAIAAGLALAAGGHALAQDPGERAGALPTSIQTLGAASVDPARVTGRDFAGLVLPLRARRGDLSFSASRAWAWREGTTQRLAMEGDVSIRIATIDFTAKRAVVWLEAMRTPPGEGEQYQVYCYLDEIGSAAGAGGAIVMSGKRLPVRAMVVPSGGATMRVDVVEEGPPPRRTDMGRLVDDGEAQLAESLRRLLPGYVPPRPEDPYATIPKPIPATLVPGAVESEPQPLPDDSPAAVARARELLKGSDLADVGEPIFAKSGIITVSAGGLSLVAGEKSNAVMATGGVVVEYTDRREAGRTLTVRAQRGVVFLNPGPVTDLGRLTREQVLGFYLEGDATASDGRYSLRGPRVYYDLERNKAVVLDAVFWTYDERRQLPLYVRAKAIRQESTEQFRANDARFSTTSFFEPEFSIGASSVTIARRVEEPTEEEKAAGATPVARTDLDARNITLRAMGVPILFWPVWAGDPADQPLRDVRLENATGSGTTVRTRWAIYQLLGLKRIEGVALDLQLDASSARGLGVGARASWDRPTMRGSAFAYTLPNDTGADVFKSGARIDRGGAFRGLALAEDRWKLGPDWTLFGELSYLGDEGVIDGLFPLLATDRREFTSRVEAARRSGNSHLSLEVGGNLNDFIATEYQLTSRGYTVSRLPEARYVRQADDLMPTERPGFLTYSSEYRVGRIGMDFDQIVANRRGLVTDTLAQRALGINADQSLADAALARGLSGDEVLRADTRHELSVQGHQGPLNIQPFVVGRATLYDEDFSRLAGNAGQGNDAARLWSAAGVRLSTLVQRVWDGIDSRLLDLHRLRHTVQPGITYMIAGSNVSRTNLPVFDDDVENLLDGQAVRVGLDQTFQTQRGGPGRWHNADVLKITTEFVFTSSDAGQKTPIGRWYEARPELSSGGNFFNADATWQVTDTLSIAGRDIVDLDLGRQQLVGGGLIIRHSPQFTSYLDAHYVDSQDQTILGVGAQYELTDKYLMGASGSFDASREGFQGGSIEVRRRFESFTFGGSINYDQIAGNTSFGFSIQPAGARAGASYSGFGSSGGSASRFGAP